MIIYQLPPEELDDKTLDKQIKAIAETLCNVHHTHGDTPGIPLNPLYEEIEYADWARLCRANYLKLVDMGLACCEEYWLRNLVNFEGVILNSFKETKVHKNHKLIDVILWTRDNVPDLPRYPEHGCAEFDYIIIKPNDPDYSCLCQGPTDFPLVMPEEYICLDHFFHEYHEPFDTIAQSYRNYYRAKLQKDAVWSSREKPSYI